MKLPIIFPAISLLLILTIIISGLGQTVDAKQTKSSPIRLKRVNPDGWFEVFIPSMTDDVGRKADVDGGFVSSYDFDIGWDYWTYEDTPNFLRDVHNNYSKRPLLSCPEKPVLRTKIGGHKAVVQKCFDKKSQNGFRYTYYVTFPKIKVYDGREMGYGVFNLSISYKNPRYLQTAMRIVQSLSFKTRIQQLSKSQRGAFLQ